MNGDFVLEAGTWERVCTDSASFGGSTEIWGPARAFVNMLIKKNLILTIKSNLQLRCLGPNNKPKMAFYYSRDAFTRD